MLHMATIRDYNNLNPDSLQTIQLPNQHLVRKPLKRWPWGVRTNLEGMYKVNKQSRSTSSSCERRDVIHTAKVTRPRHVELAGRGVYIYTWKMETTSTASGMWEPELTILYFITLSLLASFASLRYKILIARLHRVYVINNGMSERQRRKW